MKTFNSILMKNIIKFFLWSVLLLFSIWYINTYKAEKIAMLSSFDILWDRIKIFFYKNTGQDRQSVEEKNRLIRNIESILRVGESCISEDKKNEIRKFLYDINNESDLNVNKNKFYYISEINNIKDQVEEMCK